MATGLSIHHGMWILIRKELLENLLTMRLAVALVVTVVLAVMATLRDIVKCCGWKESVSSDFRLLFSSHRR